MKLTGITALALGLLAFVDGPLPGPEVHYYVPRSDSLAQLLYAHLLIRARRRAILSS